jgi:hypothetical protein
MNQLQLLRTVVVFKDQADRTQYRDSGSKLYIHIQFVPDSEHVSVTKASAVQGNTRSLFNPSYYTRKQVCAV